MRRLQVAISKLKVVVGLVELVNVYIILCPTAGVAQGKATVVAQGKATVVAQGKATVVAQGKAPDSVGDHSYCTRTLDHEQTRSRGSPCGLVSLFTVYMITL